MYACIVRKPGGKMSFFLAAENEDGEPQIPANWTVVTMTPWKPVDSDPQFSLSCSARNESGQRFSLR